MVGELICQQTICGTWHEAGGVSMRHPNLCSRPTDCLPPRVPKDHGSTVVAAIFLSSMVLDRRRSTPTDAVYSTRRKQIGKRNGPQPTRTGDCRKALHDAGILLEDRREYRRCSGSRY